MRYRARFPGVFLRWGRAPEPCVVGLSVSCVTAVARQRAMAQFLQSPAESHRPSGAYSFLRHRMLQQRIQNLAFGKSWLSRFRNKHHFAGEFSNLPVDGFNTFVYSGRDRLVSFHESSGKHLHASRVLSTAFLCPMIDPGGSPFEMDCRCLKLSI